MKKYLALLLAVLMLAMTACGSSGSGGESTTSAATTQAPAETTSGAAAETEPAEEDILAPLGEKNFGGQAFVILDANDYPDMHINMPGKELSGDTIKDAIWNRDALIEDKYRCDIQYVQMTNADVGITALRNSNHAGDKAYDICISTVSGGRLSTLATQGVLANLCDFEELTLDANWWSPLIYESCRLGDRMFFTTGDIAPAMYEAPSCVIMNRKLLEENQIETDFYSLVREGKWTVDELYAVIKDTDVDVNQDGKMHTEHDFFGLVYKSGALCAVEMVVGCGVSLCQIKDDTLTVDIVNEKTELITQKWREMTDGEIGFNDQHDMLNKTFKSDRAIAMIHFMEGPKNMLRNMESDYIVLPMPKYDAEQESYRSLVNGWCDCFVGIPNNVDTDFVGFVTEALARESYRSVRPETYDLVYKLKSVREEGSSEMIDTIFNTLYIDFCQIYNFGEVPNAFNTVIFKEAPFTSTLTTRKKLAENMAAKFVDSWLSAGT